MIHVVVAVKDMAIDAFSRPFTVPAVGAAVRSFSDEINRSDAANEMYKHPNDYDLYELGAFDDQTGLFTSSPARLLIRGQDARIAASTS